MKSARSLLSLLVVFPCLLVALSGCGGEKLATVSGKVMFQDKPLPGGTLTFSSLDFSKSASGEVRADGTYSVSRVPLGDVVISVMPAPKSLSELMPKGAKVPGAGGEKGAPDVYGKGKSTYVNIPQAYRDLRTSTLKLNVDTSPKSHDITIPGK